MIIHQKIILIRNCDQSLQNSEDIYVVGDYVPWKISDFIREEEDDTTRERNEISNATVCYERKEYRVLQTQTLLFFSVNLSFSVSNNKTAKFTNQHHFMLTQPSHPDHMLL